MEKDRGKGDEREGTGTEVRQMGVRAQRSTEDRSHRTSRIDSGGRLGESEEMDRGKRRTLWILGAVGFGLA